MRALPLLPRLATAGCAAALLIPATPAQAMPNARHYGGIPMVGAFFTNSADVGSGRTQCTGSVVHSPTRDLVLTAGHCAGSLNAAHHAVFVPQYRFGTSAAHQPHGVYPVRQAFTDPRYTPNSRGRDSDLDIAFVRVGPAAGHAVEDRTGSLTLTATPAPPIRSVTMVGYPGSAAVNPHHSPVTCTTSAGRLPGFDQLKVVCGGYYGGTSGGPLITGYRGSSRTGSVVGEIGGYNGGGDNRNDHWISYSPMFGQDAFDLYQDAVEGVTPYPPLPYPTPAGIGGGW
ncbi:hypothetical protein BIV57_10115 [Mangrovactinospora gilvigrisea]|uniref:Peptidase S1 domain-containing protein n=1 Tax=Mangrovactinospora gilvigrisea TaxID=1428644 RepID=A0A1J7BG29_9ACTN|nr:hypothetical protein BIV57_10115 [Mangrovactinospora gilvigrisea]